MKYLPLILFLSFFTIATVASGQPIRKDKGTVSKETFSYFEALQYEDINAFGLEKLSRFLAGCGNSKAEYITTKAKGFHNWNILDPVDCANWILSITDVK